MPLAPSELRSQIRPTCPSGTAIASPVGTRTGSPGASVTSWTEQRSRPASPGWARPGRRASGSSLVTGRLGVGVMPPVVLEIPADDNTRKHDDLAVRGRAGDIEGHVHADVRLEVHSELE